MRIEGSHGLRGGHGLAVATEAPTADPLFNVVGPPIVGNDNPNHLVGTANDESINGMGGDDTIAGAGGDDTIDGGSGRDQADYRSAGGSETIDLGAGTASGAQGNDTLLNIEDVRTDFGFANSITGDIHNNLLVGGDQNDTLNGGAGGDDTLLGAKGDDIFYGTAGRVSAYGAEGNDIVHLSTAPGFVDGGSEAGGGPENDTLYLDYSSYTTDVTIDLSLMWGGGSGSVLDGQVSGFETLAQLAVGSGDDSVVVGNQPISFALQGGDGNDTLVAGGLFGDTIQGQAGNDSLDGGIGDDSLSGGQGDDTLAGSLGHNILEGGAGNNWASYAALTNGVTVNLSSSGPQDTGLSVDTLTNIQNVRGTSASDRLTGDSGDNYIIGGEGNDLLIATAGADTLEGGGFARYGQGTVDYAGIGARVTIDLRKGLVQIHAGADQTLISIGSAIGSDFNDKLIGNKFNNRLDGGADADTITGGSGDDTLTGGAGHNSLDGGRGHDSVDLSALSGASATVDLVAGTVTTSDLSETDSLVSIENIVGSDGADHLTGDSLDNTIIGNAGDDTIVGGAGRYQYLEGGDGDDVIGANGSDNIFQGDEGNDIMSNGTGMDNTFHGDDGQHDTVLFDQVGSGVRVNLNIGGYQQAGGAGHIYIDGVENLVGSDFNDRLGGDGNDNRLEGGAGADTLAGGLGDDDLIGGDGADTASYADINPTTVQVSPGDRGVTVDLRAGDPQDTFLGGSDTLTGIENVIGSFFDDQLSGDEASNALTGGQGSDVLSGFAGADILSGGGGHDSLYGGLGADVMTGGAGRDHFYFQSTDESPESGPDLVTDLQAGDIVDLRQIDANTRPGHQGNQAFHLEQAFTGHAGVAVLSYDSASGLTSLELDTDGDKQADMVIHFTGDQTGFTGLLL